MKKQPGLFISFIPFGFLLALLITNIFYFGDSASSGPNQIALFFSGWVAFAIGLFHLKIPYKELEKKVFESVAVALPPIFILLTVGMLIGLWIFSGVVPTMIYYGVQFMNPNWFLPVSVVICAVVSLATGSSWSTGGTVGLALMGIGTTLGVPPAMTAGAVISGAYFGDKLSPLSDTTNLAPAMSGVELFIHIRYMLFTTIPGLILALIAFIILNSTLTFQANSDISSIETLQYTLNSIFWISPISFVIPALVLFLIAKKVPALPALFIGAVAAIPWAIFFQPSLFSADSAAFKTIIEVAFSGAKINSSVDSLNSLLSRGGMGSMLNTIWLVVMSMFFGGVMEGSGMLERLTQALVVFVRGTVSLVATTAASCIFINLSASDQYLSLVIPGRMFRNLYRKMGLAPENLSRTLEDSGTLTSVLVPWNTCGAYFAGVLGVATLDYLPYAYFNLLGPVMAVVVALARTNVRSVRRYAVPNGDSGV